MIKCLIPLRCTSLVSSAQSSSVGHAIKKSELEVHKNRILGFEKKRLSCAKRQIIFTKPRIVRTFTNLIDNDEAYEGQCRHQEHDGVETAHSWDKLACSTFVTPQV